MNLLGTALFVLAVGLILLPIIAVLATIIIHVYYDRKEKYTTKIIGLIASAAASAAASVVKAKT